VIGRERGREGEREGVVRARAPHTELSPHTCAPPSPLSPPSQSHYLVPVLSGQMTNIPNGTLSFAPVYPCPFSLPATLAGTEGTVSCDAAGTYTLALAFGHIELPAGGLSVNGKAYPSPVELGPGESVSW
jgi:hypothetical protein